MAYQIIADETWQSTAWTLYPSDRREFPWYAILLEGQTTREYGQERRCAISEYAKVFYAILFLDL